MCEEINWCLSTCRTDNLRHHTPSRHHHHHVCDEWRPAKYVCSSVCGCSHLAWRWRYNSRHQLRTALVVLIDRVRRASLGGIHGWAQTHPRLHTHTHTPTIAHKRNRRLCTTTSPTEEPTPLRLRVTHPDYFIAAIDTGANSISTSRHTQTPTPTHTHIHTNSAGCQQNARTNSVPKF